MHPAKNSLFFLLMTLAIVVLYGCAGKKPITFQPSDVLIFEINYSQNPQQLQIELLSVWPELVFDYRILTDTSRHGRITITNNALLNAHEQDHFWDGKSKVLNNKTSVWISKSVFDSIKINHTVKMPFRLGFTYTDETYRVIGNETIEVHINGKLQKLETLKLEDTENRGFKYWIWDNSKAPIVIKYEHGWTSRLTQIIKYQ